MKWEKQFSAAVLAVLVLTGGGAWPARGESPSVMLEKGLYAEQTKGDFAAAIKIYQQIIDDAKANRRYVAEAHYRLGMCLLKKRQPGKAMQAFQRLIDEFPDQKQLVAQAAKRRAETRKKLGETEVAEIVKEAVTIISTCAEHDPRVPKALATLEGLDGKIVVKNVASFLKSENNELRRSAVFVLWKGAFESIEPAVPELIELCSHKESFTRGMAAIALGAGKIDSAFQTIADMTLNDSSGYARRCAAYALGLMKRPKARPILEKALKDKDELVQANAKAALKMLPPQDQQRRLPWEVMSWIVDAHMKAYKQAQAKGLRTNTHIYGVDDRFNKYHGGFLTYKNSGAAAISEEIPLGNFGDQRPDFELIDEQGVPQKFRIEERATAALGKYRLWWTPDKPIPPGQVRLLGYLHKKTQKLPQIEGAAHLKMNNHFGSPVLENFFVVIPHNLAIVRESRDHAARERRGIFDIYLYQREVPADTTNVVNVVLKRADGAKIGKAIVLSRDDGKAKGKRSIAGSGHGVRFETPGEGYYLTHVRIYGSRYGYPRPPAEDFHIWVCDSNYDKLSKFSFPYSQFRRGSPRWVTLQVKPTRVPREFAIFVGFDPHRTKGVYVHYDAVGSGYSLVGLPGGEIHSFKQGDWMIRATLRKGIASTPKVSGVDNRAAEDLAAEGWKLWRQRKLADAEGKFKQAVEKDPANANAWNGLGWAQQNQRKLLNAKHSFEKCLTIDPKHPGALNGLGWIAKVQGKTEEAIKHWEKAAAALPTATAALNGLATTYMQLGQYDKAIKYYRMLLKTEPKNKDAKAGLKKAAAGAEAAKAAAAAAEKWLALVDQGKYAESWDNAAALFKLGVTKAKWQESIKAARGPLGKVQARRLLSARYTTALPGAPDGDYVVIQYQAAFEHKAKAVETITPMKDRDGKWRVSGYYIK